MPTAATMPRKTAAAKSSNEPRRKYALRRDEIDTIRLDLASRSRDSINARLSRALFDLGISTGLRVTEMVDLELRDLELRGKRPTVKVRKGKGGKAREVAVHDAASADTLRAWKAERREMGAKPGDPFLCSVAASSLGNAQDRHRLRKRFKTIVGCLEVHRRVRLSIHALRHTFASHLYVCSGHDVNAVRRAMGHTDPRTTTIYLHSIDTDEAPLDLYGAAQAEAQDDMVELAQARLEAAQARLEAAEARAAEAEARAAVLEAQSAKPKRRRRSRRHLED
ncbi:MAG: site-specific integrase [Planctomycetota bacterium]